jgi:hypothetical protein
MADVVDSTRSRRALLAAAAGGAAALAASAAMPLAVAAADPDDVVKGTDNATTATTSITNSTDATDAFGATATGAGAGLVGGSTGAAGLIAWSASAAGSVDRATTEYTGAYGWSPASSSLESVGVGVWGDSPDWGVFGTGSVGIYGWGGVGVIGEGFDESGPGVLALGSTTTAPALEVVGKVKFSRSGRKSIAKGKSSVTVTLAGTTTTSKVFAVLASNRGGRYVRAVVAAAGKFTIYLNTSVTSKSTISWFVLD